MEPGIIIVSQTPTWQHPHEHFLKFYIALWEPYQLYGVQKTKKNFHFRKGLEFVSALVYILLRKIEKFKDCLNGNKISPSFLILELCIFGRLSFHCALEKITNWESGLRD